MCAGHDARQPPALDHDPAGAHSERHDALCPACLPPPYDRHGRRRPRRRAATAHGEVETPVFMPVGTAGTVKAMTADAVRATGARIVLGNTYHLMLRPGAERIAAARRPAPVHGLARPDPDRFRRLPGHVAGEAAQARRRRRDVPVAYRRQPPPADAGALDRDPAPARRHHHHGAGRMHAVPRHRRSRRAPRCELSMRWAALSRQAFVAAPGLRPVRHRAGQRLSGSAPPTPPTR